MAMIPQGGSLSVNGNQIIWTDSTNPSNTQKVRLTGINWGAEGTAYNPAGLHERSYQSMIDQMAELGFNTIRLAYSDELLGTWNGTGTAGAKQPGWIDYSLNPDLLGTDANGNPRPWEDRLNALEVMDKIIEYAGQQGMRVILDHHRSNAGDTYNGNGLWFTDAAHPNPDAPNGPYYPESVMIANWENLARHYTDPRFNGTVIGADLNNEPHNQSETLITTWGGGGDRDWKAAAERIGNAINGVAPNWLIFVEGVESSNTDANVDNYGPGGSLVAARTNPINTTPGTDPHIPANRLVYSAHRYGPGLWPSEWYNDPDFPANLAPEVFSEAWGHIFEKSAAAGDVVAPLFIGEFGGRMITAQERTWMRAILQYMDGRGPNGTLGDINGDGTADLDPAAQDKGISWAFWEWTPMSHDTGGILQDDWRTVDPVRYNMLRASILGASTVSGNHTGTAGRDVLAGGTGGDTLHGGAGDDLLRGGAGSDVLDGGDGSDELDGDDLYGQQGNDTLRGGGGDDFLIAGGGNDSLDGGTGNDTLAGGTGGDTLDGGSGTDLADYSGSRSGVTVQLAGTAAGGEAAGDTLVNIEGVRGSQFADAITGRDNAADTIAGGMGADSLTGGTGAGDTLDYSVSATRVSIDLSTNTIRQHDYWNSAIQPWGSEAYGDTISGFENIIGTRQGDFLTGDSQDNHLQGRGNVDALSGGLGGDTLDGGADWDLADYSASNAAVLVNLATNRNLGGHAAGDRLIDIEQVIGSAFGDRLTGDNRGNALEGRGGDDTLNGGGGNDMLHGGAGTDTFEFDPAGNGVDTIVDAEDGETIRIANGTITQVQTQTVNGNTELLISTTATGAPTWPPSDLGWPGLTHVYVATSGSDNTGSGAQSSPYASIDRAMAMAQPGTVIHVLPGTYTGGFRTDESGTAERPIWVVSEVKGGAKLVPPANSTSDMAWDSRGSHVRIMGFEVDGTQHQAGDRWRWGIYVAGDDSEVQSCIVHDLSPDTGDVPGAGIYGDTYYGKNGFRIENNIVYNIGPSDPGPNNGSTLMHGIYHGGEGAIRGNLVYNVSGTALTLWHNATNVDISNNTVDGARFGVLVGSGDYYNGHTALADNVRVDNNILVNCRVAAIAEQGYTGTNNSYDNNTIYNSAATFQLQNGNTASGTSTGNPMFVNAAARDYRLQSGSPAIDGGYYDASSSLDLDGWTRGVADRGAYERTTGDTVRVVVNGLHSVTTSGNTITLHDTSVGGATAGNDTLTGTAGADTIDALSGNDSVSGLDGNDSLLGNDGADTLDGGAGNDTLDGGNGTDLLRGGDGTDSLRGGAGNDTLDAGGGTNNILDGGGGSDTYLLGPSSGGSWLSDNASTGNGDHNRILLAAGVAPADVRLQGSGYDLTVSIVGTGASMFIPEQFLYGPSPTRITGIEFADGTVWDYAEIHRQVSTGTPGNDTLTGDARNDTIHGGAGNDHIFGGHGGDHLFGGDGNDTLSGGFSSDTLTGGAGNDVFQVTSGDTIADAAAGDTIDLYGALSGTVTAGTGTGLGQGQVQMEVVNGNTVLHIGTDTTPGSDEAVYLTGVYAPSQFTLSGSDILVGPPPEATVAIQAASVSHDEGSGTGTTTFSFTVDHSGGPASIAWSVAGATVNGANAADFGGTMPSGTLAFADNEGPKTLSFTVAHDTAVEADEGFTVTIANAPGSSAQITRASTTGTILNDDGAVVFLPGGNDSYTGTAAAEEIYAQTGDDTVDAAGGDDSLFGEGGHDWLRGGDGNDNLFGAAGNDTLDGGAGIDYIDGGTGTDTIVMRSGYGYDYVADFVAGNGGDVIDLYQFSGMSNLTTVLSYATQSGSNTVIDFGGGTGLTLANVQKTALTEANFRFAATVTTGTSAADVLVGTSANNILLGLDGNDTLLGDAGDDSLEGGAGTDQLFAGTGNDTVLSGSGNDYIELGGGSDTFVFKGGDGFDFVSDFVLSSDVIDLRSWTTIHSLSDLQAVMTQSGSNAVISLQSDDGITLANVTASSLTASNFIFA